jgi:DNA-binding XRE family transcriptional regulator
MSLDTFFPALESYVDNALLKVPFMWNLKQKVKRLRKKRKWTQEDLARKLGVSLSTVQRWERQGGKPIRIIARELDRLFTEVSIK